MYGEPVQSLDIPPQISKLDGRLRTSAEKAISAFNQHDFIAACTHSRRTLEGVLRERLHENSNKKVMLGVLLEKAEQNLDLMEPIRSLSKTIKEGGNLAAHFDGDLEPDQDIAKGIVELIMFLVAYLYELPEKISDLEKALGIHEVRAT